MPEAPRPGRVVAVQADVQYQPAEVAGQHVRVTAGQEPAELPWRTSPGPAGTGRLLVVVHGALRDAGNYLAHAEAAAREAASRTFIVAPQFLADVDLEGRAEPWPGTLYWDAEGWKGGEQSLGTPGISSFAVMDALLDQLTAPGSWPGGVPDSEPPTVVVFGNSAGGQYVNRYAAVGRGPGRVAGRGIAVRFVISNPSTYLYFTPDRPGGAAGGAGVNRWRYGFDGAPAYVEGDARENLRRYLARDVTIVLGREDSDGASLLLETGDAAMAQGANRYQRGVRYHAYVSELARQEGLQARHQLIGLEGVGHAAADVMAADPVRDLLFG